MANHCVVAIFDSTEDARLAVHALERSPFPSEQVSLVTHSVADEVPREEEETLQTGDKAETRAAKGAGLGGLVGALLAAPLLAIPGVGQVLVAGPLAAGLTGAIVGGFLGSMSGWGVHEDHVRKYESLVQEGKVLVVANGTPDQVVEAQELLREMNPVDMHLHAPIGADSPEVEES